ncbi:MAG: hypothetical protein ACKVY0_11980 [Prosthecobacter sp.]|uniref:hypothetical protein n=1 Tax=Prosthecobacter sp. TaxID=1965333 RepID=UPI003902C4B0
MSLTSHDKRLHFGCGFVFGGVLSFLFLIEAIVQLGLSAWFIVIAVATGFALFAMRHGEVFWDKASSVIATLSTWLRH